MKTLAAVFLALVLSVAMASAASFTVEMTPVKDKILINEVAEFTLTITNNAPFASTFAIGKPDYPRWDIRQVPDSNPITIEIPAESSNSLTLLIDPNQNYIGGRGSHSVNIEVKNSAGDTVMTRANVGILNENPMAYTPTVVLATDYPEEIDPSKPLKFTITLSNQNPLNITDAVLRITSKLMNEEIPLSLGPQEEKVVDVAIPLDKQTAPMKDIVTFSLKYYGDEVFLPIQKSYTVKASSGLTTESQSRKRFLGTETTYTFNNIGNAPYAGALSIPATEWKQMFQYTKPSSKFKEGAYVLDTEIAPGKSMTVVLVESYVWLLVLVIVSILVYALVQYKRIPIVITKKVAHVEAKEGNVIGLKLLVTVRNRSAETLHEVVVTEKLPKLLSLEHGATIGSLPPTKVFKGSRGETFVRWELKALGPDEERVVNYRLQSHFHILGGLTLSRAVATAKLNGQEVKAFSQAPRVQA